MNFEYIFSGCSYIKLEPTKRRKGDKTHTQIYKEVMKKGVNLIKKELIKQYGMDFVVSLLFNALVEKEYGPWFVENDMFGFDNLYGDSGGLQAITRSMVIGDDLKRGVYETQTVGNFGFCFDEIPVEMWTQDTHRSGNSNKIFFPDRIEQSAKKTASNIKEQIEYFYEKNAKTKVFFILQGNRRDDFVKWFEVCLRELEPSHLEKIAGLAMAGSCIGAGSKELVESMIAYKTIEENYDIPFVKDRLHFLGMGGISRIAPIVYLYNAGFFDKNCKISIDSTSFSMAYTMGIWEIIKGRHIDGNHIQAESINMFYPFYKEYGIKSKKKEMFRHIVDNIKSMSDTYNKMPHQSDAVFYELHISLTIVSRLFFLADKIYNLENALSLSSNKFNELADVEVFVQDPLALLSRVKTLDDIISYEKQFGMKLQSKLIKRWIESSSKAQTIDTYFS